jgi:carbonic anhydrase
MRIVRRKQLPATAPDGVAVDVPADSVVGNGARSWSYVGTTGPDHWADLDPGFAACRSGAHQSPVALTSCVDFRAGALTFDYRSIAPIRIVNDGITVIVPGVPSCSLQLDGERFELQQLHFHHPAEHAIDEILHEVEIHFVHRSAGGTFAVIAVLAGSGLEHEVLSPFLPGLPRSAATDIVVGGAFYPEDLLPPGRAYMRYSGSRTMPPCEEGVEWLVMNEPIELSPDQIAAISAACPANARPMQPLNGRTVVCYGPSGSNESGW